MKGYHTEKGYMGYVNGDYMLFASETDYYEFLAAVYEQKCVWTHSLFIF